MSSSNPHFFKSCKNCPGDNLSLKDSMNSREYVTPPDSYCKKLHDKHEVATDYPYRRNLEKLAFAFTSNLKAHSSKILSAMNKITTQGIFPIDVGPKLKDSKKKRCLSYCSPCDAVADQSSRACIFSYTGTPDKSSYSKRFIQSEYMMKKILDIKEKFGDNNCKRLKHGSMKAYEASSGFFGSKNDTNDSKGDLAFRAARPTPPAGSDISKSLKFTCSPIGPSFDSSASVCNDPETNTQAYSFYHKVLTKLGNKKDSDNFNICLFLILSKGTLLCDEASIFPCDPDLNIVEDNGEFRNISFAKYNKLKEASVNSAIDLSKEIPLPTWYSTLLENDSMCESMNRQNAWNPFTIFGSAPKAVVINDVFNFETYANWTSKEARRGNFTLRNLHRRGLIKDPAEGIFLKDWNIIEAALQKKWSEENRLDLDWRMDPLLIREPIWYIDYCNFFVDKSREVIEYEVCFCPTPDPRCAFGWTDLRSNLMRAYNGRRVSGGALLSNCNFSLQRIRGSSTFSRVHKERTHL